MRHVAAIGLGCALVFSCLCGSMLADDLRGKENRSLQISGGELGKVELVRDQWGVPNIFSESDFGAFWGLGYASAEDRGFQMYYNLRSIQGRLSEIHGKGDQDRYLTHDRKMRTIGFYRTAASVVSKLDSHTLRLLHNYSQGVNEWFRRNPNRLHPFFAKLGIVPEPWTPADCIASWWHLGQYFSTDGLQKLDNFRAINRGESILPPASNLIVDDDASVVRREDVSSEWLAKAQQYDREHSPTLSKKASGTDSPSFSHAWVVGGKRTSTGASVLVSDPQLPVCNPSLLYEFHLCGKSINARGVGVPGSPGLLIGFNQQVAWGATALGADQADLFRLTTDGEHPNQYRLDGKWLDMQLVDESIRVKGGTPVDLKVRLTHFGPIVSEFAGVEAGDPEVALKRVPLCDSDRETIQGTIKMMSAGNMNEFIEGLSQWRFPTVNLVFGDSQGNVGYWMQAAVPSRARGDVHHGEVAHDGSLSQNDWQGFVPHDLLPHVINPQRGWIASGNHRPIGSFYPIGFGIGKGSTGHTLRSWRLYERLSAKQMFQPAEVFDIHFDDVNPMRRDVVKIGRYLASASSSSLSQEARRTVEHLENWSKSGSHSDMHQTGIAVVLELITEFRANTTPLAKVYGGGQAGLKKLLVNICERIERPSHAQLSHDEIKLFDSVLAGAWKSANLKYGPEISGWDQQARQKALLQRRGYFEGLGGLGAVDASGELLTPALDCIDGATIKSQSSQGYTQYVPLHDADLAQSLLPPGQSERIDSRWRTSTWELWEKGRLHPAPLSRHAVSKIAAESTALKE